MRSVEKLKVALELARNGLIYCQHSHMLPYHVKPENFKEWQIKDHQQRATATLREIDEVLKEGLFSEETN